MVAECDCSVRWTYVGTGDDSNPAPGWSIADQYEALGNRPFTIPDRAHAIRVRGTSNALPIMVSNVGQDVADFKFELTRDLAQRFTTGNNLTSYTLYAIDLRLTIPDRKRITHGKAAHRLRKRHTGRQLDTPVKYIHKRNQLYLHSARKRHAREEHHYWVVG